MYNSAASCVNFQKNVEERIHFICEFLLQDSCVTTHTSVLFRDYRRSYTLAPLTVFHSIWQINLVPCKMDKYTSHFCRWN